MGIGRDVTQASLSLLLRKNMTLQERKKLWIDMLTAYGRAIRTNHSGIVQQDEKGERLWQRLKNKNPSCQNQVCSTESAFLNVEERKGKEYWTPAKGFMWT